jgi:hypothetical protein
MTGLVRRNRGSVFMAPRRQRRFPTDAPASPDSNK